MDTIGQYAEPPGTAGILVETCCTGASAFPSDLHLCPRACSCDRYVRNAGFTLAEKTSLPFSGRELLDDGFRGCWRWALIDRATGGCLW